MYQEYLLQGIVDRRITWCPKAEKELQNKLAELGVLCKKATAIYIEIYSIHLILRLKKFSN